MGAASGGVWKSTDSGAHWNPIFDSQSAQAIGAMAVSPANPNIVWAGTGEAWAIRDSDMMGNGIYKSTDAAQTWTNMGLAETGLGQFSERWTFSIAPSEIQKGLIWAGTNDGKVWYTRDAGKNWNDVTRNIAGMPLWGVC